MIFCSWVISCLRPAAGRAAVPALGENRDPPSGSASETNNDCQIKFELIHMSIARHRKSQALLVGGYAVKKVGVARFDWRDPYYFAVALSWPHFLLSLIALFAAINLVFAMLYLPGSVPLANAHPGSLSDAFFFSMETATTVGYGDMYPVDHHGRIVAGSEMIVGGAFTALTTGLLFVRFSRPKAQ